MLKRMNQYLIEKRTYVLVFTSAKHIQSEIQIVIQQQQIQQPQQQKMVQNKLRMTMKIMMM